MPVQFYPNSRDITPNWALVSAQLIRNIREDISLNSRSLVGVYNFNKFLIRPMPQRGGASCEFFHGFKIGLFFSSRE